MRAAARLILQLPRSGHVTKAMHDRLHWLDMQARIEFKLYVLLRIDVFMVWRHHTFPGCASRCPSSLVALTYARLRQVNYWFPPAKRKQLDQGLLQLPAQLLGTILPIELLDPANSDSLPTFKMKLKTHFWCKCWPDTDLHFCLFSNFFGWCYWYVLWECSFREHANTSIIIIIISGESGGEMGRSLPSLQVKQIF